MFVLLGGALSLLQIFRGWTRGRRRCSNRKPLKILLTGRVDSENWARAHLMPLIKAGNISEILIVLDGKVKNWPKIRPFPVPRMISRAGPKAIARSLWAIVVALRERPDVVMAYSLFPPGFFGLLAARMSGSAAVVQLAGGPVEIESGGLVAEEPLVPERMREPLASLCKRLCGHFDAVIVRGGKAAAFVRRHSRPGRIEIIPGSIDPVRFQARGRARDVDIAFVGRIVPFKQPDHLCQVFRRVAQKRPAVRVVVAGRGPLLDQMKRQVKADGLAANIRFAGHVEKVEALLSRTRVFLLTSRSEGLSIALAEAMAAGAVPVVPDVGDLGELVINGQTGWLIPPGDFDAYAARICALLEDEAAWGGLSGRARKAALENNAVDAVAARWQTCLGMLAGGAPLAEHSRGNHEDDSRQRDFR